MGSFAANGYGLHDMTGNVWDWVHPSVGTFRVLRGGGWSNTANLCRVGYLHGGLPDNTNNGIGFRTVLPLDQ